MSSRRSVLLALASAFFAAPPLLAQRHHASATRAPQPITVRWLGHATFEVTSAGGTRILIDPFITQNPSTPDSLKSLDRYSSAWKPNAILVSHAHFDHSADVPAIAKASGAPVISVFEYVNSLNLPQAQQMGGNVGGEFKVGDVIVHLVPAMHSSEPGRPLGFILHFADGRKIYFTGDTWIFGDMSLIQEQFRPDIILLNVGGGPYTEDPATAAMAVRKYFTPKTIVPMHYGTFPGLASEAQVRAAFARDHRLVVMKPGQTIAF